MSIAEAIIVDVLADPDEWWDGELQTVTGFCRTEYEELRARLCDPEFTPSSVDKRMLHQAANNLLGYPGISTAATEAKLGSDWRDQLEEFMTLMRARNETWQT